LKHPIITLKASLKRSFVTDDDLEEQRKQAN